MSIMASPFTGLTRVCLVVWPAWHQRKHQNPFYWPFVREIHRWPVDFPHKGPVTQALMFPLMSAWTNNLSKHALGHCMETLMFIVTWSQWLDETWRHRDPRVQIALIMWKCHQCHQNIVSCHRVDITGRRILLLSHMPLCISMISGVCVSRVWNAQVKGQVSETHRLKVKKHQQPLWHSFVVWHHNGATIATTS